MQTFDAIVVGGGPGGSACATKLVEAGLNVAVLDRQQFPRTKLCAGWVTPEAVEMLNLDLEAYPHRFNTFEHIVIHLKGLTFKLDSPQHSIRRYEFDDYLLKSSGAQIRTHNVKTIEMDNGDYIVDGQFRSRYLVGAGGTPCPVYRTLFRDANPRAKALQVATYEHEFPYEWNDPRCHLWFFDGGLRGYAWYVPKQNGFLNCGLGGMSEALKAKGEDIKQHWNHFTQVLGGEDFVRGVDFMPKGYSYYLRDELDLVRLDNALLVGDSVGLATRDLCEGIGPAVHSGQLAAQSILTGSEYSIASVSAFSSQHSVVRRLLEYMFVKRSVRA
jgi:flavin-dependent dehydrogenase